MILPIPTETEELARVAVDAAFKVHKALGPGLLESVYEICMAHEIGKRGLDVQRQVQVPIVYDGIRFDTGLRLDLLVEGTLVIELKSALVMHPVFEAQILSYLKLSGRRLGLLINFYVPLIKQGIKRIAL